VNAAATPVLATHDLGLDIGGATIVADVDLSVPRGELLGIIGPNGAGKTSLFNLLSGILRPTTGTIELGGRDITRDSPASRASAGIGRTFQISSVFPRLPALENVRLAAEAGVGGALRPRRLASRVREAVERARWALDRVGLGPRADVTAGSLAHGDKRKLELAMLLAADRAVILLDEPMAGVSVEDVPALVDVIRSVHESEGKTVLMVEHHIDVVTGLAERIAVMHHGRLLAVDTTENVLRNEEVQAAYLGEPL
jgi:branched-chain amino acid transport system ATP-binding protein